MTGWMFPRCEAGGKAGLLWVSIRQGTVGGASGQEMIRTPGASGLAESNRHSTIN